MGRKFVFEDLRQIGRGCGVCQHTCPHHAIRLTQILPLRENLLDYFKELKSDLS